MLLRLRGPGGGSHARGPGGVPCGWLATPRRGRTQEEGPRRCSNRDRMALRRACRAVRGGRAWGCRPPSVLPALRETDGLLVRLPARRSWVWAAAAERDP